VCRIFNKFSLSSLVGNATTGAASATFSPAARVCARRPCPSDAELNSLIDDDDDEPDEDAHFAPFRIDAFVRAPFTAHVVNAVRNIVVDIIMSPPLLSINHPHCAYVSLRAPDDA
jgi:hypothetical protein